MRRLTYFLTLFSMFTVACGMIFSPIAKTAVPVERAATEAFEEESPTQAAADLQHSALVDLYDPARDPAQDLKQAVLIAQQENKRILLELGGDWCIWCKYMDEFYATHGDILQFRADHYVLVKVNVSPENENREFLSQFPEAAGYPHIYILESDGTFLHSQDTVDLEDGNVSYVPEVFMAFLQKWAPPK